MGSVHLVCRPRPEMSPIGDWGQVLRELPKRVADWMNRLQEEGVRGADLVFACIGPALEVYSRYSKVVDAEEREIPLGGNPEAREAHQRGFLAYVWEVVGRAALEEVLGTAEAKARNGAAGALEEDARLTALFLWTLQATTQDTEPVSTTDDEDVDAEPDDDDEDEAPSSKKKKKGLSLPFDVARRFAQPLGIHLDAWEGRCIETEKGIVRLIPVLDRAEQLFGQAGAEVVADRLERYRTGPMQGFLPGMEPQEQVHRVPIKGRRQKSGADASDESLWKSRIIITSSVETLVAGRCPMTVGRIGNPSHNHSVPGLFPSAGRLSITANTNHDEVIFAGFPYRSTGVRRRSITLRGDVATIVRPGQCLAGGEEGDIAN